ncbi:MAG: o-succinylbenzoate synthase [Cytophagales bacterium]|nr:o-succinylbenzoate synthase [Bernardetiaceae bacterium]MDW8211484.1 o-succinylbenzoate synthase [Cytophagales bacterium]
MIRLEYKPHLLRFRFEAGTSRGIMTQRPTWFVFLTDSTTNAQGIGEAAPLEGLSVDFSADYDKKIYLLAEKFNALQFENLQAIPKEWLYAHTSQLPALRFALETALLDLQNGGKRLIFDNAFYSGNLSLPINGLIWMGKEDFMLQQVEEKLAAGFTCLKMKVGAIDFDKEINILRSIRQRFSAEQITLRLDANGAFSAKEASEKLSLLADFDIHSIEQPIKPRQWKEMATLCQTSPIPIALDEELIGILEKEDKIQLLEEIRPAYIILKPSLLGGFQATAQWIALAEERSIGWWITSALESNIGLNAICQFTAQYQPALPQGLGTGQLYYNNIGAPLQVRAGYISYQPIGSWDLTPLFA